jgi:sugar lactone lactonase YvrE
VVHCRSVLLQSVLVAVVLAGCSNGSPPGLIDAGGGGGSDAAVAIDAGTGSDAGAGSDGGNNDVPFTLGTSTVAGGAEPGYFDGSRKLAMLANPVNVAYRDNKLYVADFDNDKIRMIDLASYETTTMISQPSFQRPFGLAFAPDGTLYASTDNDDIGGHSQMSGTIWSIAPGSHTAVVVARAIGRPRGLVVLGDGKLAASDYQHHVIQIVDPGTGEVTPLAGTWDSPGMVDATGTDARFSAPYGMAVCDSGDIVVADFGNHQIRVVTRAGVTTTLAGTGSAGFADGDLDAAMFRHPDGVAIASNGDVYVSDSDNFRIRRITSTAVETIAGNGTGGYRDSDDPLTSELYGLEGIAVVPDGSMVYVADGSRGDAVPYHRIRQIAKHW